MGRDIILADTDTFFAGVVCITQDAPVLSTLAQHVTGFVDTQRNNSFPEYLLALYSPAASLLPFEDLLAMASQIQITVTQDMAVNVEECIHGQANN